MLELAHLFAGSMTLEEIMSCPIPLLNDLTDAQVRVLKARRKAEEEAMRAAQANSGLKK